MIAYSPVLGEQRPRISCIPEYGKTAGSAAIELAAMAGLHLDDWQAWLLSHSLGIREDGLWSAFEVGMIVARQNGKTAIIEARELAGLFLFGEELIIHTAHEYKTAAESYRRLRKWIEGTPELLDMVKQRGNQFVGFHDAAGEQGIELKNGQRIRFIARSRGSGRGFTGDLLIWDEAMILDAGMVGSTLPTLAARPNPQVWYAGSAGLGKKSSQLADVRRRGIANDSKSSLFFVEWSIRPHSEYCEPNCTEHDDPSKLESVAMANPALGIRISAQYIERERAAMSSTPGEYEREHLGVGQYPAPDNGWLIIPEEWWNATEDEDDDPPLLRGPVFAIDMNPERSMAAIAVAGLREDGRIGVELVESRNGTKWLMEVIERIDDKHKPIKWIVDPRSSAGSLIGQMQDNGLPVEKISAQELANGCGLFFDGVRDDWLWHKADKRLRAAIAGADKRPLSDAWAWDRKNSAVDISPLVAATMALWGYQKYGKMSNSDVNKTVHFNVKEIIRLVKAGVYGPADLKRLKDRGLLDEQAIIKLKENGIGVPQ